MCKATVLIFFIIEIVSILLWPVSPCRASQAVRVCEKGYFRGTTCVIWTAILKMLSTFKILFKNYVFLESDAVWLWRIGQTQNKKKSHESFDVVTNRPVNTTCFQTAVER